MKVFLIVLAVIALIIIAIMCLSATITLIYDNGWTTRIGVLFFEKDIELSKILSFILFPEKKAKDVADEKKNKKNKKKEQDNTDNSSSDNVDKKTEKSVDATEASDDKESVKEIVFENPDDNQVIKIIEGEDGPTAIIAEKDKDQKDNNTDKKPATPKKKNPIAKLWDEEGIVGILNLVSNLLETASSAVLTLIRGLHIYSLYVMIIVGGGDADQIANTYGKICRHYYPLKGMIVNGMKVDNYDDYIQPDFIAERTEIQFQFIGSISVGLLFKVVLKAAFIFVKNLIKNK